MSEPDKGGLSKDEQRKRRKEWLKRRKAQRKAQIERRVALQEQDELAGRRSPPHPTVLPAEEKLRRLEKKRKLGASPAAALLAGPVPINKQAALGMSHKRRRRP